MKKLNFLILIFINNGIPVCYVIRVDVLISPGYGKLAHGYDAYARSHNVSIHIRPPLGMSATQRRQPLMYGEGSSADAGGYHHYPVEEPWHLLVPSLGYLTACTFYLLSHSYCR